MRRVLVAACRGGSSSLLALIVGAALGVLVTVGGVEAAEFGEVSGGPLLIFRFSSCCIFLLSFNCFNNSSWTRQSSSSSSALPEPDELALCRAAALGLPLLCLTNQRGV